MIYVYEWLPGFKHKGNSYELTTIFSRSIRKAVLKLSARPSMQTKVGLRLIEDQTLSLSQDWFQKEDYWYIGLHQDSYSRIDTASQTVVYITIYEARVQSLLKATHHLILTNKNSLTKCNDTLIPFKLHSLGSRTYYSVSFYLKIFYRDRHQILSWVLFKCRSQKFTTDILELGKSRSRRKPSFDFRWYRLKQLRMMQCLIKKKKK